MSAPLWSYVTISLVVGYLNYRLGQVGNGHLLYIYFGNDWKTVLKIGLFGNIAAPKYPTNQGANQGAYKLSYNYNHIPITYCPLNQDWSYQKRHWFPNPTTWWQHCKVVADWRCTFLSNTPSLSLCTKLYIVPFQREPGATLGT